MEGDWATDFQALLFSISIHSLRVEGDGNHSHCAVRIDRISIHSLRVEGDVDGVRDGKRQAISIHSLRVEGDSFHFVVFLEIGDFNPLPPCGGRLDN